jgi:hypothetical protein
MLKGVCPKASISLMLALSDQELNDVSQSLIRGRVQRGPAVLSDGIHVDAPFHEELCRLDRHRLFLRRSPLDVRAAPAASISAVVPWSVVMRGSAPAASNALIASRLLTSAANTSGVAPCSELR